MLFAALVMDSLKSAFKVYDLLVDSGEALSCIAFALFGCRKSFFQLCITWIPVYNKGILATTFSLTG